MRRWHGGEGQRPHMNYPQRRGTRPGVEMAGEVPLEGGGRALRECLAYGTIASAVVTHRLLLHMCGSLNMEYTMSQPLKRPFHNNLEKCPVVKVHNLGVL